MVYYDYGAGRERHPSPYYRNGAGAGFSALSNFKSEKGLKKEKELKCNGYKQARL